MAAVFRSPRRARFERDSSENSSVSRSTTIKRREETMRSSITLILILLLAGSLAGAQNAAKAKAADQPTPGPAVNLPSEATVESFLQQTFGHDPQVSWKISSIKPLGRAGPGGSGYRYGHASGPARQPVLRYCRWRTCRGRRHYSFRRQAIRCGEDKAGEGNHWSFARTERRPSHHRRVRRSAVSRLQGRATRDRGTDRGRAQRSLRLSELSPRNA